MKSYMHFIPLCIQLFVNASIMNLRSTQTMRMG